MKKSSEFKLARHRYCTHFQATTWQGMLFMVYTVVKILSVLNAFPVVWCTAAKILLLLHNIVAQ